MQLNQSSQPCLTPRPSFFGVPVLHECGEVRLSSFKSLSYDTGVAEGTLVRPIVSLTSTPDQVRSREFIEQISFVQNGVRCTALIISDPAPRSKTPAPARAAAIAAARKAHYSDILPSPEEQHQLMRDLRKAEREEKNDPTNAVKQREVQKIKVELFERFSRYITNAVNSAANRPSLSSNVVEFREELRCLAVEIFYKTVDDFNCGGGSELCRPLSVRLKYGLHHLAQRLAATSSSIGALQAGEKVLADMIAYKAAARAGALDALITRKRWSEKKIKSVRMNQELLEPATRLDAPAGEDGDCTRHDVTADPNLIEHREHGVDASEAGSILANALNQALRPVERLVVVSAFGIRGIDFGRFKLRHAETNACLTFSRNRVPALGDLPSLLGMGAHKIRAIKQQSMETLLGYFRANNIGAHELLDAMSAH